MKRISLISVLIAYAIVFLHAVIPHVHHSEEDHLYSSELSEPEHHHHFLVSVFSGVDMGDDHLEEIMLPKEMAVPDEAKEYLSLSLSFKTDTYEAQIQPVILYPDDDPPVAASADFYSNFYLRGPPVA